MRARRMAGMLLILMAGGCGRQAVRPPSPALDLEITALLAAPKPEHEHYYVIVFGSQTTPRIPRLTHTWATVVKTYEPPGASPTITGVDTISWLPATLEVRPFQFRAEPAVNLDMRASIEEMLKNGETVSFWGPYETWSGLHTRFLTQKAFLESGAIGYQCTDGLGESPRLGNGSNCFHAISDADPQFDRRQYPLLFYGNPASKNIVRQLFERPVLIHPNQTHDWLIPALGLDRYPINQRHYKGEFVEFTPEGIQQALSNPTPRRPRLLP